jgi:hypothetical protein
MEGKQSFVVTNFLTPDRAVDYSGEITRFLRIAEHYRILADCARTESARKSYRAMAADYDDLAKSAEETLAAAKVWRT